MAISANFQRKWGVFDNINQGLIGSQPFSQPISLPGISPTDLVMCIYEEFVKGYSLKTEKKMFEIIEPSNIKANVWKNGNVHWSRTYSRNGLHCVLAWNMYIF